MVSTEKKSAGLLYGPELHHLDHLAIICALMRIPLVVTDEEILRLAGKYYPDITVHRFDYLQVAEALVSNYDVAFSTLPRDIFDEIFFFAQKLLRKRMHTIWCPHGNSDKGHASFFMEGLKKEEIALVYGQKMIDFLMQKGAFDQLKKHIVTGNFRYSYYKKQKEFYDRIVNKEIKGRLDSGKKTLLFAPTWQDSEKSSSFFDATPYLIEELPSDYNLIIKLHPNLVLQNELAVEELLHKYEDSHNILFLKEFPPIYPLLDFVDVYLGDMSSIGYDFLIFDKPMFFLNQNDRDVKSDPGLYLYRCGVEIKFEDYKKIYSMIEKNLSFDKERFSKIRKEVYDYTFGKEKEWENLRHEILFAYDSFSDREIDLL